MFTTVKKLHEKPEHIRRRYALGISFGVTALIALVWVTSFTSRLSGTLVESDQKETVKPLAAVVDSIREGAKNITQIQIEP
jgi:hypothetical protein